MNGSTDFPSAGAMRPFVPGKATSGDLHSFFKIHPPMCRYAEIAFTIHIFMAKASGGYGGKRRPNYSGARHIQRVPYGDFLFDLWNISVMIKGVHAIWDHMYD